MIEEKLNAMTDEEMKSQSMKTLESYYRELTGVTWGRKPKNKDEAIMLIKRNLRARARGRAFAERG